MNRGKYKVFISSTYRDNEERRKVVEDAILRAGMHPVGMERFTASTRPTVNECERFARECDIYLGIVAHRYGWIPEGQRISITELEYDAARAANRPRLMFEIPSGPGHPIDIELEFDPEPERWDKQKLLAAFRAKYRQDQMLAPFKETTLSGMVVAALNQWREEREGKKPESTDARLEATDAGQEIDRYRQAAGSLHASIPLAGFKTKLRVNVSAEVGRRVLQPAALWMHAEEGRTRASAQELAPVLEPALRAVQ